MGRSPRLGPLQHGSNSGAAAPFWTEPCTWNISRDGTHILKHTWTVHLSWNQKDEWLFQKVRRGKHPKSYDGDGTPVCRSPACRERERKSRWNSMPAIFWRTRSGSVWDEQPGEKCLKRCVLRRWYQVNDCLHLRILMRGPGRARSHKRLSRSASWTFLAFITLYCDWWILRQRAVISITCLTRTGIWSTSSWHSHRVFIYLLLILYQLANARLRVCVRVPGPLAETTGFFNLPSSHTKLKSWRCVNWLGVVVLFLVKLQVLNE